VGLFLGKSIVTIFLLQLIKCWTPRAAGRRSAAGGEYLWLRLTTASTQCLRLSERFFHSNFVCSPNSITNYDDVNGRKFLRPPSYCDTVCLRRTPLLMCDPFVVANLRVELFQCHVQHPMFYLDICWRKCSWEWLLLLVKIKHCAQT